MGRRRDSRLFVAYKPVHLNEIGVKEHNLFIELSPNLSTSSNGGGGCLCI